MNLMCGFAFGCGGFCGGWNGCSGWNASSCNRGGGCCGAVGWVNPCVAATWNCWRPYGCGYACQNVWF